MTLLQILNANLCLTQKLFSKKLEMPYDKFYNLTCLGESVSYSYYYYYYLEHGTLSMVVFISKKGDKCFCCILLPYWVNSPHGLSKHDLIEKTYAVGLTKLPNNSQFPVFSFWRSNT